MVRRAALLVSTWLALLGTSGAARAEPRVTIDVDATAAGAPLERIWAYHGYDEANYTTTPEGEALLRTLSAAHTADVRVRTHFLLNSGDGTPALKWGSTNVYREDESGNPLYDYTLLDRIMDATLDAGTVPLVELGFMPQALSTRPDPYENSGTYALDGGCFYPPRDYERWAELVAAYAEHVKERYPEAASRFEWELWNEPDILYWHGTFEEYARLYDHTEAALHSVLPDASLGGPAVASVGTGFLQRFLEHCATGANAVSGETGTRLDMVSFHAKGGVTVADDHVRMNLGAQLRLHRAGFQAVAASAFARTPVVISEADPDGCAACPATEVPAAAYRNFPAYGAYEVSMMKRSLELAEESGVDLRGVLTWAFTFPGTPYFAGYRALATNGIHLPVLNAFKLLGSLRGARLPVISSGARPLDELLANGVRQQPDVDALAARDGDEIRILVFSYHDDLVDAPAAPVTLTVALPAAFPSHARMTHTRVDDAHGNAHAAWLSLGSPAAPSEAELRALAAAMEPVVLERDRLLAVTSGAVRLSLELPRFGLSLVTLEPASVTEPKTPAGDPGCSCRVPAPEPERPSPSALLAVALAARLARRRRARRA